MCDAIGGMSFHNAGQLIPPTLCVRHAGCCYRRAAACRLRIYHYYLPVFFWIQQQLEQHRVKHRHEEPGPPLMVSAAQGGVECTHHISASLHVSARAGSRLPSLLLLRTAPVAAAAASHHRRALCAAPQLGISAPQGCGKSTLVEQLQQLCAWLGLSAASVSIDDFYLTNAQQGALAAAHPDNRLLALRGNAGSHDLELGQQTLLQLRGLTEDGATARVPRRVRGVHGPWVCARVRLD
jgi:hypothetical protein